MPIWEAGTLGENLQRAGVSRRDFLAFCGRMAAVFAVGAPVIGLASKVVESPTAEEIAYRLENLTKPNVVWLQLQECTGCLESTLRSGNTTIEELVLNLVSVNYVELLMAASGSAAEAALDQTNAEPHILVVNGSVPLEQGGAYTVIGGKSAKQVLEESARNATYVLAVGACAVWGCVQASSPNPTGAVGVDLIVKDKPVVNVAGCPPIGDVITAAITYLLTYDATPPVDDEGRPLFAYGQRIHDACPRRAHFDAGQYVSTFDDSAARQGWCLYEMGCKGPDTFAPCPIIQWNLGTSFPIGAGHPCLGCTEVQFFDRYTPFYRRLPDIEVPGVGIEATANRIGATLLGLTAAGIGIHAAATAGRRWYDNRRNREEEQMPVFGDPASTSVPVAPPTLHLREPGAAARANEEPAPPGQGSDADRPDGEAGP